MKLADRIIATIAQKHLPTPLAEIREALPDVRRGTVDCKLSEMVRRGQLIRSAPAFYSVVPTSAAPGRESIADTLAAGVADLEPEDVPQHTEEADQEPGQCDDQAAADDSPGWALWNDGTLSLFRGGMNPFANLIDPAGGLQAHMKLAGALNRSRDAAPRDEELADVNQSAASDELAFEVVSRRVYRPKGLTLAALRLLHRRWRCRRSRSGRR